MGRRGCHYPRHVREGSSPSVGHRGRCVAGSSSAEDELGAMLILASLGALALASRWSPAARWMTGAVGFLGGLVALLALLAILVRLLFVAGFAASCAVAATAALWPQAGAVLAV